MPHTRSISNTPTLQQLLTVPRPHKISDAPSLSPISMRLSLKCILLLVADTFRCQRKEREIKMQLEEMKEKVKQRPLLVETDRREKERASAR